MALRWQTSEPRVRAVVAITPYAGLSNAVMNLRGEYASWLPKSLVRAGLRKLPGNLGVPAGELDTMTVMARMPRPVFLVAAEKDKIAPLADVQELARLAPAGSQLLVVPEATHETVTYYFPELVQPVLTWLAATNGPAPQRQGPE
jgi:pimeloyl-ACP methyl ester carboxylesterase